MNTTVNTTAKATTSRAVDTSADAEAQQRAGRPEPRLLTALRRAAERQGHSQIELAHHLGVTSGYLIQLRSGTRDVRRISLDFARACAAYLETSTLNVLLLAGSLDVSDFSVPGEPQQRRIREGLQALREDPLYSAYVDEAVLESLSDEVKQLLVGVYEEACQREFFPSRALPPALLSSLRLATLLDECDAQESGDGELA